MIMLACLLQEEVQWLWAELAAERESSCISQSCALTCAANSNPPLKHIGGGAAAAGGVGGGARDQS